MGAGWRREALPIIRAVPRPAFFILLAVLALLPACGWREEPVGARADLFPVEVADATGAALTVPAQPQVVASLDPDATVTMKALGFGGRILDVANAKDDKAVAAAQPDLVVVPLDTSDADVARLGRAGTAPVFRYGAVRFDDAPRVVARLGLALGRGPEGVALGNTLREELTASLARAAQAGPTRVFIDGGGLFTAFGPETEYGQLLATVGAGSIVPRTTLLRFSQLERADPDAWVLTASSDTTPAELRDPTSPLTPLRAVSEGRIIPLDLTDYGITPNLPKALDALVRALHAPPVPLPPPPATTGAGPTGTSAGAGTSAGTSTGAG
jgi:ABC-type Fe3+-hydroxamate transport system substrate-binding protein